MSEVPSEPGSHENQTELERVLRQSKPWFEENLATLLYALAAVVAVAAVVVYLQRPPAGSFEASADLLAATSPEEYADIADSYPSLPVGSWSRLRQADRLLDDAVANLFKDRKLGTDQLDQAETAYNRLAERTDLTDELRERVLIGLARLSEARCDGSDETIDTAVKAWQRILDEFPASIVKAHAKDRLEKLPTEDARSFYKWFAEYKPKPSPPPTAPGQPSIPNIPIEIPGLNGSFPESTEPVDSAPENSTDSDATENTDSDTSDGNPSEDPPAATEPSEASAPGNPETSSDAGNEGDENTPDQDAPAESGDGETPDSADAPAASETPEPEASTEDTADAEGDNAGGDSSEGDEEE